MIIDALLNLLIMFLNGLVSTLSQQQNVPPMTGLATAISTASSYYSGMFTILPNTLISAFAISALTLSFIGIYFVYKMIRWAYRKIPGIT